MVNKLITISFRSAFSYLVFISMIVSLCKFVMGTYFTFFIANFTFEFLILSPPFYCYYRIGQFLFFSFSAVQLITACRSLSYIYAQLPLRLIVIQIISLIVSSHYLSRLYISYYISERGLTIIVSSRISNYAFEFS